MSGFVTTRRSLLQAGATVAIGAFALASRAGFAVPRHPRLALLDGALSKEESAIARASIGARKPVILGSDMVWQWRQTMSAQLAQGRRATAITRWDKAFVLKGLAREAALEVRQRRVARSLFQTDIG